MADQIKANLCGCVDVAWGFDPRLQVWRCPQCGQTATEAFGKGRPVDHDRSIQVSEAPPGDPQGPPALDQRPGGITRRPLDLRPVDAPATVRIRVQIGLLCWADAEIPIVDVANYNALTKAVSALALEARNQLRLGVLA